MFDIDSIPEDTPEDFIYLWIKANRYLKTTPELYRERDFFKMPSKNWTTSILNKVQHGMEQISRFHGHSIKKPLDELGIEGFYALLHTLHFEVQEQRLLSIPIPDSNANSDLLDEMHMRHRVTGNQIVLYNRVTLQNA